ncbi:MAG TPA: DUF4112 domain-containing protein [Verrucomicrobiae bacterium]|nr:DUF4112 domain-containing protein [Verrucomicrobiae bacterium]
MSNEYLTTVTGQAERIAYPPNRRLQHVRFFSNLLDQCITLPGGFRIGIDPIIGLIPGIGDALSALLSLYLVYQAALLGLRKRILLRMVGNVAIESLVGTFPVLGDVFDAVWKANMRNLRLIELHYAPGSAGRSQGKILVWIFGVLAAFFAAYLAVVILFLRAVLSLFGIH